VLSLDFTVLFPWYGKVHSPPPRACCCCCSLPTFRPLHSMAKETGHNSTQSKDVNLYISPPTRRATKSRAFPRVLFVVVGSSSLGGAVEGGRPTSSSPAESSRCVRSVMALAVGPGPGSSCDTVFFAFPFPWLTAVTFTAFVAACLSVLSFTKRSFCVMAAAVNPAASGRSHTLLSEGSVAG
jgi:hypothetical protein